MLSLDLMKISKTISLREDILYVLNRLSSAAHVLMCRHLSELRPDTRHAEQEV